VGKSASVGGDDGKAPFPSNACAAAMASRWLWAREGLRSGVADTGATTGVSLGFGITDTSGVSGAFTGVSGAETGVDGTGVCTTDCGGVVLSRFVSLLFPSSTLLSFRSVFREDERLSPSFGFRSRCLRLPGRRLSSASITEATAEKRSAKFGGSLAEGP
jgi:hypothetical protein